jgi:spermidine synthase
MIALGSGSAGRRTAASVLFFLSGATGLVYEVVWFKRFSHVWGSSTLAMATVVASFLFALGLGARRLGPTADRLRSPLLGYAACEAGIGLFALAIPFEIEGLLHWAQVLQPLFQDTPALQAAVRLLLTLAVLGPPCFLMGPTLPFLVREFCDPRGSAAAPTAWAYAVNTLGAATGCFLAGFHLLPTFGLSTTNVLAAATNLGIGAAASLLVLFGGPAKPGRDPKALESQPMATVAVPSRAILAASALAGCAALILQVVWTRQLALILGGATYAFSAMLFVVLLGIGCGSLLVERRRGGPTAAIAAIVTIVVATVGSQWAIPGLTFIVATAAPLRASQLFNGFLSIGASGVLEFLPTVGMGALFPLLVRLAGATGAQAGSVVGRLYGWNTAGTLVGAAATSMVLVPRLGSAGALALAVVLYGAAALLLSPRRLGPIAAAVTLGSIALRPYLDPQITDRGMYLYGYSPPEIRDRSEVVYFAEGAAANVLLLRSGGDLVLRTNGKVDGSDRSDMNMQLGLAYFPRFLRPEARNVLVIGFGTGTTSGASLLFPGTRVLCAEIERAVFGVSPHFGHVNHSPERSDRFRIVFDDGRAVVQGSRERWDLILSEPSNPWRAGVSNLFTEEFYEAVRRRLAPGGVLAQWIQLYGFTRSDYALVVRTVARVFPHRRLVRINDSDTILLASESPLEPEREGLRTVQHIVDSIPEVRADLEKYFGTADVLVLLLSHAILDEEGLQRLLDSDGRGEVNTDRNLRLEFDAPKRLFEPPHSADLATALLSAAQPARLAEWFHRWGGTKKQVEAFRRLEAAFLAKGLRAQALQTAVLGLRHDPEDVQLLADRLLLDSLSDGDFASGVETLLRISEQAANRLGVALSQAGAHERAAAIFRRLVERQPSSAIAWNNLALALAAAGRHGEAEEAFSRALALDPLNEGTERSYRSYREQRTRG